MKTKTIQSCDDVNRLIIEFHIIDSNFRQFSKSSIAWFDNRTSTAAVLINFDDV